MLDIRKTAIALEEEELLELEQIIVDRDDKEALAFLKKSVYDKIVASQKVRCEHEQLGRLGSQSFIAEVPDAGNQKNSHSS